MSYTISYPRPAGDGLQYHEMVSAPTELEARARAASLSRQHGHATITNQSGLVATYVNGAEWHGSTTATSTEEAQP